MQSSIWSNDNIEESNSIHDTLNCREIFDQASDTDSTYFSLLNPNTILPIGLTEKRSSYVSLSNHSENSVFTEVISSKKGSQNNLACNKNDYPVTASNAEDVEAVIQDDDDDEENLLTSERTHFKPISYPDGYSFDIPNDLDNVEYFRSGTGSLYLDSEQYMELKVPCMKKEFSLKDGDQNVETDEEMHSIGQQDEEFVIKFCVKKNEKFCQTNEADFEEYERICMNAAMSYYNNFRTNWRYTEQILTDTRIDYVEDYGYVDDQLDEPKCLWNHSENHNNNNAQNRVWEACPTCQDSQSFPANRRLKDELHADGEEILSDLNYFQSLIIGNDWNDEASNELEPDDENIEYGTDGNLIDGVYHKVDKLVSNLLNFESKKALVKALDTDSDWESVTENNLLPFAYLFNCQNSNQRHDTSNLSDDEKVKIKQDASNGHTHKAPPDKHQLKSSIKFLNLCNYIDGELLKTDKMKVMPIKFVGFQNTSIVRNCRLERKRRHSACKNLYNSHFRHVKLSNYDDLSEAFGNHKSGIHSLANPNNNKMVIDDLSAFGADNSFYTKQTDASLIFRNNNILLKQIDLTRPLTR